MTVDSTAKLIERHLRESARTKERKVEACSPAIAAAIAMVVLGFISGGKLPLCGNRGGAGDCQTIAAEFTRVHGQDYCDRSVALPGN
jgi:phosphoheptose isomerase